MTRSCFASARLEPLGRQIPSGNNRGAMWSPKGLAPPPGALDASVSRPDWARCSSPRCANGCLLRSSFQRLFSDAGHQAIGKAMGLPTWRYVDVRDRKTIPPADEPAPIASRFPHGSKRASITQRPGDTIRSCTQGERHLAVLGGTLRKSSSQAWRIT